MQNVNPDCKCHLTCYCSKVYILIISSVTAGCKYHGGYGGAAPQKIKKQVVGQLHPLCKVAIMRMNPAVYKLQNMFMPQEKVQRRHQFYRILQRGLFRNSRGRVFENFFWEPAPRPPFSLFPCSHVS